MLKNFLALKRRIYIFLVILLCALLGVLIYVQALLMLLNRSHLDLAASWPAAAVIIIGLALAGGSRLGKIWWRFVYIDKCRQIKK